MVIGRWSTRTPPPWAWARPSWSTSPWSWPTKALTSRRCSSGEIQPYFHDSTAVDVNPRPLFNSCGLCALQVSPSCVHGGRLSRVVRSDRFDPAGHQRHQAGDQLPGQPRGASRNCAECTKRIIGCWCMGLHWLVGDLYRCFTSPACLFQFC